MLPFNIVGTGPGSWDLLTLKACQIITSSQIIIGSPRSIKTIEFLFQDSKTQPEIYFLQRNHENIPGLIRQRGQKKLSVLVSGDPGFYSLLGYLAQHFEAREIQVCPGISSIQAAAANLTMGWQNSLFFSVHGREIPKDISAIKTGFAQGKQIFVLLDSQKNPSCFADMLKQRNFPVKQSHFTLFYNLGYENQKIIHSTYSNLKSCIQEESLCLMLLSKGTII
ncbi:MAG: precorrin-6y C5,15-methyltransferase (decarboxylating) subunit CbiE [Spirochaetales bacterium]|nr:precorrin-6y C5,15-methyltransferase (decarboxylating) subunit CbiE [Spirochaetales bacterium]